jgi:hypothetical protein
MGNTTHFGFSWPRVKFGFGLNINYSIYNKDMIREYIIEELKYATYWGMNTYFKELIISMRGGFGTLLHRL